MRNISQHYTAENYWLRMGIHYFLSHHNVLQLKSFFLLILSIMKEKYRYSDKTDDDITFKSSLFFLCKSFLTVTKITNLCSSLFIVYVRDLPKFQNKLCQTVCIITFCLVFKVTNDKF